MKSFIYFIIFGFLLLNSCEKGPFNYRNKYLGEWDFIVKTTEINTDSIGYYHEDSFTYSGEIKYGESNNEIIIEYLDNRSITLSIDEDGVLSEFPTKYCGGKFDGEEKINLYLKWGGLGGGVTHVIEGKR